MLIVMKCVIAHILQVVCNLGKRQASTKTILFHTWFRGHVMCPQSIQQHVPFACSLTFAKVRESP